LIGERSDTLDHARMQAARFAARNRVRVLAKCRGPLALANNRDLRVAMSTSSRFVRNTGSSASSLFPQVGGFADGTRNPHAPPRGFGERRGKHRRRPTEVASRVVEIDFFGRLRSLNDAALQHISRPLTRRQAAEILLVSQVSDQYLALLASTTRCR